MKMNNLTITKPTLDSREIAGMVGVKHYQILEKLEGTKTVKGIIPTLTYHKIVVSDYFIKSSYRDESGKENKCYLFTKMGCEFIANKFTGEKGILFTAKYVQAFNQMEEHIKSEPKKLSALEQLQLQNQAILEVNEKVDKIKNDMPLFKAECDELQALVRKTGIDLMGGKRSPSYKDKSLRTKIYSDIQHQLRREFGVEKYAWIKHSQFNRAREIIACYTLPIVLGDEVTRVNSQMSFEEVV